MRIKTLLVSGEYPDLLGTEDTKFGLVIGGAFIRLDDYLDSGNYPLLKEHVDPYIDYLSLVHHIWDILLRYGLLSMCAGI